MSVITLSDNRLGNFYPQNPTFAILTFNFSNQTALSQLNWQGLNQATVVDLLKQYRQFLSDEKIGDFYKQNSNNENQTVFDIFTFDFNNQTELSKLKWNGSTEEKQQATLDLLKKYQRLLRLNPNPAVAQNLLKGSQIPISPSPTPTPPSDSSTPRVGAAPGEPGTPAAMAAQAAPLVAVAEPSSANPILTSAHEIVAMPEAGFVQTYSPAVGGEDAARTLYRNAKDTEARTMLLWANARALAAAPHFQSMRVNNISDSLVEHFQSLPSYQDMFDSLNYCECEHCRSIFSPAAYFVDLMRIAKENIQYKNPKPGELNFSLDARRPDLAHIPLTCENTNNEIPYLDIVNKALALNAAKVGVISYWPLDEGNGQRIGDQIDGNTGTLQGNVQWITATDFPGVAHRAVLQFDGKSNYVTIPNSDSLNFDHDQDFTIEVWVKAQEGQLWKTTVDNSIIEKPSPSNNSYAIRYYNETVSNFGAIYATRSAGSVESLIVSKTKINDDKFHHVAFTKQGSQLYLYVDGELQGQTQDTTRASTKNASPVFIASRTPTSHFFKGQIANIRIWDVALTPNDIWLLDSEETAIDAAYQILAVANYPSNLPFNLPLEQIRAYLQQLNTDLASIYRVFGVSEEAIARESLGLSIEEYNLIINPKPDLDDLSIVYDLPVDKLGDLIYTDIFLHQTGLSRQDLHTLCYQNLSQQEIDSGIAKSFFINQKLQQTTYFQTSDNIVSYWPLNEGSGISIGDRTGSNNGTLQGTATWRTATDFPGTTSRPVLQFDGTSNYVPLASASELGLTASDFTVEAWVKADDLSSNQAILCTDAYSDNRGLHLMILNQKAYMGFYANDLAGQTTLVGGSWYHIVWRYTKSTGEQAIFINGELNASSQGHRPFAGTTSVNIGRWAGKTYFKGQIAEVRIWNTALSSNEVRSHHLNPTLPDPVTLDRVNRFIRLAKKLNWSFTDLDWVLTSLKASEITSDAIQQIAKIKLLKDKLKLPLDVLCSFWHDLKTIGVGDFGSSQALFDVVFNNPQLIGSQDPYHPGSYTRNPGYTDPGSHLLKNPDDSSKIAEMQLRSRIAAGLRISLDDLTALLNAPISRQFLVSVYSSSAASGTGTSDRMSSHYGTLKGSTAWVTTTAFSENPIKLLDRLVLQFDGQASYATIPNSDGINFDQNQDFTVEVWIKPEAKQLYTQYVDNSIIEKPSALNNSYAIRYYNQTTPGENHGTIYAIRSAGSETPLIVSTKKVNDGKFHHIAFIKQGSQLCLYVDGELQGQTEDTTKASTKNSSDVFIAARTPTSHFFKGQIADVRIWNRALSNDEIRNASHQITSTIIVPITDLNVQNLSVLYRHSKLASLLGLPIEQYLLSLRLLNQQKPALSGQDIIDIFDFAIWSKFSGFNVYELDYILNDHESKYVKVRKSDEEIQEFLRSLWALGIDAQPPLKADDILDWSNLCKKLAGSDQSNVSKKIRDTLSLDIQQVIQQVAKEITSLTNEKKLAIVQALNGLLKQILFEKKQDLESIPVSEEVKDFLSSKTVRSQNEIQKLNRLLLETAYPHEIAKGTIRKVGDEWKEKLLEHLATFLGGTADIIEALLETIAQNRTVDNTHSYIEAFLTPPQDSQQNPNHDYIESVIHLLLKGLLLNQKLQFTPYEIDSVRSHPQCFLIPDCQTMSIDNLKSLWIFKQLTRAFNDTQNQLLDLLTKQQSAESLEKITGWSNEQSTELITNHFHNALTSVTGIAQLKQVFDLSSAIGVNISFHDQVLALADSSKTAPTSWADYKNAAQSVLEVVKAKYHDDDWVKVSDRLNSSLNESKRDALSSFVLWQLQQQDDSIKTLRQLSEYLLLDVETTGCASISPIKQATLSLQMYLQRCRMNLEPGVTQVDIPPVWWEWMMNYRVWEANRKVFLYPENYIEPNLRKDKTDLFKELESELLQTEITQESVEAAYRNYFDKLAELAKLRIAETYRCKVEQPDGKTEDTLFIFGKTATEPRTYYYRTCINPTATPPTWNPWTKIDLNINSDYISPVFAFNKLFVFWVEIKETTDSSMDGGKTQKTTTRKATIKYTFQTVSQKWVQPQTLCQDIVISRQDASQRTDTSQQIQNIDPIWRKAYPLSITKTSSIPEKILIAFGDILTQKNSWDYQFSTPASTLSNDLLIKNKSLILKTTNSQAVLIENYVLDFATSKPRDSLVASWLLNEGEGKTISDQANHNNGTLQGNETWVITRVTTGSGLRPVLQFDGSTSYIEIPATAINNLQSGTIEAWVYLEDINCATILSKQPNNVNACSVFSVGYRVGAAADPGTLHFHSRNAGGQISSNGKKIQPRRWTHVAVTFSSQSATLYIDGRAAGTQTGDFTIPDDTTPTTTCIGSWGSPRGGRYFLSGKLANIRIWNIALTPEQILSSACPLIIDLSKADSSVLTVKNQPNWFTYDNGDEAFLVVPQGAQPSLISESLQITDDSSLDVIELTYQNTSQETSDDRFVFTRLTTSTTRQLSQKAFIGGIDHLLTLDSQLTPELDFSRFNPSPSVIPPTSQALDFNGAFGLYFQEIFFHIPFLVANTLNANQRFAEAQKWYHYIFNPTQPQLPQAIAYWPLDEGSGTRIGDRVSGKTGNINNVSSDSWSKISNFLGSGSRSVLQFEESTSYATIPNSDSINFDLDQDFTVEVWIKPNSEQLWKTTVDNSIIEKCDSSNNSYAIRYYNQTTSSENYGTIYAIRSDGYQSPLIVSEKKVNDGEFHHIAFSKRNSQLYLYVDGELQGQTKDTTKASTKNNSDVFIAARTPTSHFFKGQIANVRIWNTALSPEQILDSASTSLSDRFWRYLPFRGNTLEKLQELLKDDTAAVKAYNDDPFDPHAIAQLRIGAYQKAIVMKYIDNLLDWGDSLYAQDTWESITQATMLYLLAYDLLGSKPEDLGKCPVPSPKTFDEIQKENPAKIPQFLIDLEQMVGNSQTSALTSTPFNNLNTYFGISENEQFIAYWDRVEDRLYKIRHCQNLEGIVRQLALYEPPINPMELVRAVAAGNVPMSVVSGLTAAVPHYRFDHMLDRAKNITSTLIQLGSSLLSALEKKDAEQLSLLRASQESAILRLIKTTKENQIKEAQANLESLNKSYDAAQYRVNHYQNLIDGGLSAYEQTSQSKMEDVLVVQWMAFGLNSSAAPIFLFPNIFGFADGGEQPGMALTTAAAAEGDSASIINQKASLAASMAQYERRLEEWELQCQIATNERDLITQQKTAAEINITIAVSELNAHQKSLEHADEVENFFKTKFSTPDLYQWMVSRLSTLYFQTFKIALDMALAAQKAYQYELNKDDTYISFDYWDSLKKGLLAGEGLMLGLSQLEKAYLEGNERRLEIEKTISLLQFDPKAFLSLKNTGKCQFPLGEKLFDSDFPGHYCRQIKTISISIPAVVSPYQNIKATLTQLSDKTLLKPDLDVVKKLLNSESVSQVDPSILRTSWRRNQKIALSKGINDTGLFELSFRDERYLPFEGTGAISTWELSLPKSTNQINFDNLTDVIITLSYTALDAGEGTFKQTVQTALNPCEWFYYISLNQAFSSEWHQFVNSKSLKFNLSLSILPTHIKNVHLQEINLALDSSTKISSEVHLTIEKDPQPRKVTIIDSCGELETLGLNVDQFCGDWIIERLPDNLKNVELVLKFNGDIDWDS